MKKYTLNSVRPRIRNRIGMTLIEILIVIAIIAVLAGLLIPVVGAVRRRGQVTATVLEIQNLKNAIEQYKQKFGDYPPDGSNAVVFQRHIRVAFPRIAPEEFKDFMLLVTEFDSWNTTILDPAEALVFFLGGFSDDPRYPFTGKGGPLTDDRNPGLFDFDPTRISIFEPVPTDSVIIGTSIGLVPRNSSFATINLNSGRIVTALASGDETTFDTEHLNDIFPVYLPKGQDVPFVYFDTRTYMSRSIYTFNGNLVPPAQYPHWHLHDTPNIKGVARPYRSDEPRRPTPGVDLHPYKWINPDTFQIISAGTDNDFGDFNPANSAGVNRHYPSGDDYSDGDNSNITSFSRGTLEDDIP